MPTYCIDWNVGPHGEHEMHDLDCDHLPAPPFRLVVGCFPDWAGALAEAKKRYSIISLCKHCSNAPHSNGKTKPSAE